MTKLCAKPPGCCLSGCLIYPLLRNKPLWLHSSVYRIWARPSLAFLLLCVLLAGITKLQSEGFTCVNLGDEGAPRVGGAGWLLDPSRGLQEESHGKSFR